MYGLAFGGFGSHFRLGLLPSVLSQRLLCMVLGVGCLISGVGCSEHPRFLALGRSKGPTAGPMRILST